MNEILLKLEAFQDSTGRLPESLNELKIQAPPRHLLFEALNEADFQFYFKDVEGYYWFYSSSAGRWEYCEECKALFL